MSAYNTTASCRRRDFLRIGIGGCIAACFPACGGRPVIFPAEEWERSSPKAQGLRQAGFDRIEAFLTEKCGGQPWRAAIVHRGRLIWERAAGITPGEPLPSHSIVKSVIASCAGIALDSGLLPPLSDGALEHFPELLAHIESSPEIAEAAGFTKFDLDVSIEMLLDHTGGFFKPTKKPEKGLVYGTVPSIVLLNIMAGSAGRYHPENIHLGGGTGNCSSTWLAVRSGQTGSGPTVSSCRTGLGSRI